MLPLAGTTPPNAFAQAPAVAGIDLLCPLVEHERQRDLEDAEFDLELVKLEFHARERLFDMVDQLWAARSIEREMHLDYKRLRDRARVRIELFDTQVAQQKSIAEQYGLACAQARGEATLDEVASKIEALQSEYRRLDCELLETDSEIAAIDRAFDEAMLEATRTLAERNIKTKFELVIEEYDLSQSKARSESYQRRARACRKRLAE